MFLLQICQRASSKIMKNSSAPPYKEILACCAHTMAHPKLYHHIIQFHSVQVKFPSTLVSEPDHSDGNRFQWIQVRAGLIQVSICRKHLFVDSPLLGSSEGAFMSVSLANQALCEGRHKVSPKAGPNAICILQLKFSEVLWCC